MFLTNAPSAILLKQNRHGIITIIILFLLRENNQILIRVYMWEPFIHEKVRDSTGLRGSETEKELRYMRHSELEMR